MTMPMLIPKELGLPAKYTQWRPDQADSVEAIYDSGKNFFLLDGPVGSGKSLVAVAAYKRLTPIDEVMDRMLGDEEVKYRCLYLTKTKQLQSQLIEDFPEARMIKGRSNFICPNVITKKGTITCDECPGKKCADCPYLIAKSEAVHSPLAVLNDDYFLSETNGPGQFSNANMIVVDEIDSLESSLLEFIKFSVSEKQCKNYGLNPPNNMDSLNEWLGWLTEANQQINWVIADLNSRIHSEPWSDKDISYNREIKRAESFLHQMKLFQSNADDSWIIDMESGPKAGWIVNFKPVIVGPYADKYMWRHGERFLGMSGTILDPEILAEDLGFSNFEYRRLDSKIPVENRMIYFNPVANLKYDIMDRELPKLVPAIIEIVTRHINENVLIHTTSNKIRDYMMNNLSLGDRLMTHDAINRVDQLALFKSQRGRVMVSPSFDRGVDLPGDQCRCVIIVKMPYLFLGDKQVKKRLTLPKGQRWYNLRAIQTVMQMTGRAVRHENDYADTYILDRQFDTLLARTRHLLPKWWLEAIKRNG